MDPEILQQLLIATMDMTAELKKKKVDTGKAIDALRTAKVILSEYAFDKESKREYLYKAYELIENAQREIFLCSEPLGVEFVKGWEKRFRGIFQGHKTGKFVITKSSTFYPSLPRCKKWVRIAATESIKEKLKGLKGIEIRPHGKEHVLLIGEKNLLRKALDDISPLLKVTK